MQSHPNFPPPFYNFTVFVQDFHLKLPYMNTQTSSSSSSSSSSSFHSQLSQTLQDLHLPVAVHTTLLSNYDLSTATARLVISKPGHFLENDGGGGDHGDFYKYGLMGLSRGVDELRRMYGVDKNLDGECICTTSSLGNPSPLFLSQIYSAMSGRNPFLSSPNNISPNQIQILYPSKTDVKESASPTAGGSFFFDGHNWKKDGFPRDHIHRYISKSPGALSHSKLIHYKLPSNPCHSSSSSSSSSKTENKLPPTRATKLIGYYYAGSHNTSMSAWGNLKHLKKMGHKMSIGNYEVGVLLPVFAGVDGVAEEKDVWAECVPYREPSMPYDKIDSPFSQGFSRK